MPQFKYYKAFFAALADEKHVLKVGGDTLKARLLTTALDPTDDTWSDISADEVATGGGYTVGGVTCSILSAGWTNGAFVVVVNSPAWTGSGSGFSFRSLVLLNDTAPADELIGGVDFGRTVTIATGENTETLGYTAFNETDGLIIIGASVVE
jgi:hypothetical protein